MRAVCGKAKNRVCTRFRHGLDVPGRDRAGARSGQRGLACGRHGGHRAGADFGHAQQVGGPALAEGHAGGNGDLVTRRGVAFGNGGARGSFDHFVDALHVRAHGGMDAPRDRKPARDLQVGRDADDRRARPLARGAQRGRAGGGIGHRRGGADDVRDFAQRGANGILARVQRGLVLGLGAAMNLLMTEGVIQRDVINEARILTSAACDARMAGINMPVMSSAGSGNHGITAIIPPTVMCEHIGCDDEKLVRTLAFSHLTTAYIKVFTGGLSPVCGCAVAAGIGASAAVTWALGGTNKQIGGAIKNMVGTLAGMVCDGAKGGCAFKLSTASSEAIIQAKLAMSNIFINDLDGIINPKTEETIKNLGQFCNGGMKNADKEIIDIMLKN